MTFRIAIPRPRVELVEGGWATYVGVGDGPIKPGQIVRDLRRLGGGRWSGRPFANGDERWTFGSFHLVPMVRG